MPQYKQVELGQKIYHYLETGEGQPLIILHGWCDQSDDYIPLMDELSKKFRVIAPDLPNFGRSNTKDTFIMSTYDIFLREFIENLGIKNPLLLGHSFGGKIAIQYASLYKETRIILVNSSGLNIYKNPIVFAFNTGLNSIYELITSPRIFIHIFSNWTRNFIKLFLRKDFWELFQSVLYFDYPQISKVESRVLIIWSPKDRIFSKNYPFYLQRRLQSSVIEFIPGGHFGCITNARMAAKLIKKYYE